MENDAVAVNGVPENVDALITPALIDGNILKYEDVMANDELIDLLAVIAKLDVVVYDAEIEELANEALVVTMEALD